MGLPNQVYTRDQIAARILAGENIVLLNNKVLRIPPSWLATHPGGAVAILHFVGRNAADEVEAFHSDATLKRITRYVIGTVDIGKDGWKPFVPPIMSGWVRRTRKDGSTQWFNEADAVRDPKSASTGQILLVPKGEDSTSPSAPVLATIEPSPSSLSLKTQHEHSLAYKELHKRITEAGLYQTRYLAGYGPEIVRYIAFVLVSVFAYRQGWFVTSATFLGFFWHQITFTAHDLAHNGVTHNWVVDRLLGTFLADFLGGLSINWWADNHNTHHLVTNHPSHDPDIQHLPFFAISPAFLTSLWSSYYKRVMAFDALAKIIIPVQHYLFYVVMSLARFNLYALSYRYLALNAFKPKRATGGRWWWWTEVFALCLFYCWYGAVLKGCGNWWTALKYVLVSNIVPSPLHVQIVLSHFSRSTEDLGVTESFAARQLRTTADVICSPDVEFIHGGLHLQVTHHLFPRLPRHNLREASLLVKQFAQERGLEYAEFGFVQGNKVVRGVLKQVAEQVKIVGMVADAHVREAIEDRKAAYDS